MAKYLFFAAGLFNCLFFYSCGISKVTVQQNAIDSVIRKVVPAHNCDCNNNGRTTQLPLIKNAAMNNAYYWQLIYVNKESKTDYAAQAVQIKKELTALIPTLKNYQKLFLEFRMNTTSKTDTVFSSTNIGTAYFILKGCDGYAAGKTHEELINSTKTKKSINTLCTTNN